MPTTTKWGLRYPALTDTPDVPRDIQNLANDLDDVAKFSSGALASRPASKPAGYYYYATDAAVLYLSDGATWQAVNPKDAAAVTASLRTLGTGSTQAAAGDHTHTALSVQAAGTPSVRLLGTGATDAAAGNHNHDSVYAPKPLIAYKTSDTVRTTTGAVADPQLVLSALPVGSYIFSAVIVYTLDLGTSTGLSMNLTGAGITSRYVVAFEDSDDFNNAIQYIQGASSFTAPRPVGSSRSAISATGSFDATSTGTFSLVWAIGGTASGAEVGTVIAGSYLRVERVA